MVQCTTILIIPAYFLDDDNSANEPIGSFSTLNAGLFSRKTGNIPQDRQIFAVIRCN